MAGCELPKSEKVRNAGNGEENIKEENQSTEK